METNIVEMRLRHKQEIQELQAHCEHKKSSWVEECWAIAHFTGRRLRVCDTCEKTLETSGHKWWKVLETKRQRGGGKK